jgi:serine/threonine protein kinase
VTSADPIPDVLQGLLGQTVAGAFRLDEVIGSGGMGVVFGGEQLKLRRAVAVKVLDPGVVADTPSRAARFEREAESVARLDHPNCLQVYDYGTTEDGLHYMVMPRLTGRTLRDVIQKQNLSPRIALDYVRQILAGLEHAHGHGIVHRDLKPANIFVVDGDDDEVLRIVDFGIAKIVDDEADERFETRTGVLFGTPAYMSPEQAAGEQLDGRSDLYSLGVVLWRMIAGYVPNRGRSVMEQMRKRATLDIPPLPEGVPEPLSELVHWLCRRDIALRCADATQAKTRVKELLDAAAGDESWDKPIASPFDFVQPSAGGGIESSVSVTAIDPSVQDADDVSFVESPIELEVPTQPEKADRAPTTKTVKEPAAETGSGGHNWKFALVGLTIFVGAGWAWNTTNERAVGLEPQSPRPAPEVVPTAADETGSPEQDETGEEAPPEPKPIEVDEPQLLAQLTSINVREPESALPLSDRHALLAQLRANEAAAGFIDETANAVIDLSQAADAEAPCEVFDQALERLEDNPQRWVRRALRRARVPAGDAPACASAKRHLAEIVGGGKTTTATTTSAPPDEGGDQSGETPPKAGEITPKLGGLK